MEAKMSVEGCRNFSKEISIFDSWEHRYLWSETFDGHLTSNQGYLLKTEKEKHELITFVFKGLLH